MNDDTLSFFSKLEHSVARNDSLLCVGLDPNPDQLPQRFRDQTGNTVNSLFNWNKAIIESTVDLVCVYKPNIAFYEALGPAGSELLQRTLDFIPDHVPVLLDAKRGDMGNTAAAYAKACFEIWQVDAVTLSPYLGHDSIEPFTRYPGKGLFVLCHTSNPGAQDFQPLEINDWQTLDREPHQPLYIHIARTATAWSPNVGLVVGATYPGAVADVRAVAPVAWFLLPGIGAQGGDLEATVSAGLREDSSGILVSASRSISLANDPANAARTLRDAINVVRDTNVSSSKSIHPTATPTSTPAITEVAQESTNSDIVTKLVELGALQFGDIVLASGIHSPFYIDLRLLVSDPALLAQAAALYANAVATIPCDRLAGVPYAALPIGTAVAIQTGIPLIYTRKETKMHGMGKEIEGQWSSDDQVIIIEDVVTSGGSILNTAERLRAAGLNVDHAVVLIDREQGGVANLAAAGITLHHIFTLTEVVGLLVDGGHIDQTQAEGILGFAQKTQIS